MKKKPEWTDLVNYMVHSHDISPQELLDIMIKNCKKLKIPKFKLLKLKRNMDRSLN